MKNINQFFKISEEQFNKDKVDANYEDIKLPKRATKGSAGYDFYSLYSITLNPGETIKIATGIRVKLNENNVLLMFPRSSLGFKYKLKLDNTVGVIDSDYFNSDNEGHIWVSMTNTSNKVLEITKGSAICQGLILSYDTVIDDDADGIRSGGIGSTNKI